MTHVQNSVEPQLYLASAPFKQMALKAMLHRS